MTEPEQDWRPGPWLFGCAVVLHIWLLQYLGPSTTLNEGLDANVYLELARNLWVEGRYVSSVGKVYPPGYPMLIAPLFAFSSNALRFWMFYTLHGLLIAGGSLTLFGLLRQRVGARAAWITLALAQWLAGVTIHALHPRSEALFTALALAAAGAAWRLGRRGDPRSAALLGLCCGFAVATRRTGLALLGALVLLHIGRSLLASRRGRLRHEVDLAGAALSGVVVGLIPELLASILRGGAIRAYSDGVLSTHLGAGVRALGSDLGAQVVFDVTATHIAYYVTSTLAMPLVLLTALAAPSVRQKLDRGALHVVAFTALAAAGLAAASSLHVIRYWLRRNLEAGYDLYPRYLDPMEPGLVLVGFAVAGAALSGDLRARLKRFAPGLLLAAALLLIVLEMARPRGYRLPWPQHVSNLPFQLGGEWLFTFESAAVLVLFAVLVATRQLGRVGTVALVVLLSWVLSFHLVARWVDKGPPEPPPPVVLTLDSLQVDPTGPVALVMLSRARDDIYRLSWKSNHDLYIIRCSEIGVWVQAHPEGLLVALGETPLPLPEIERFKRWRVYGTGEAGSR